MNNTHDLEYLVLGAGPAGLQLAFFLHRAGRRYLVLEKADGPGAFFRRFPRHRTLLSINKVYTGYPDRESQLRYDWNSLICDDDELKFTTYSDDYFPDADALVKYLSDFAQRFSLHVQYNTQVVEVARPVAGEPFVVTDQNGRTYRSRVVVVATGCSKPYVPDIPGIEHAEPYTDFSVDRSEFRNQRVLILGKSNSALETANHLTSVARVIHICSPNPIRMAWKTHYVGDIRAVNNDFLDTYLLKGQNASLDANVNRIEKVDGEYHVHLTFTHAEGQRAVMAYDRILCCTGFRWDPSIFADSCRPELSHCGRLPAMTSAWESPNIPDLYFAGTLMQFRDSHKTMSNVIHGFRFNIRALNHIFNQRYHGVPLPYERLRLDVEAIAGHIIDRISRSAALLHQPGFLGDVMVVKEDDAAVAYYGDLPVDYVHESEFAQQDHYYVITLEYGHCEDDIFMINRRPDARHAENDVYLHPRIRRFAHGKFQDEHHISESLENDWRCETRCGERPVVLQLDFVGQDDPTKFLHTHRNELKNYLARTLAASSLAPA